MSNLRKKMGRPNANYRSATTGQAMMLSVFAIGATILGAATVAGLLMFYQIRQATDLSNSNQAIFAADSGVEWGLYQFFKVASSTLTPTTMPSFSNDASISSVDCYDDQGNRIATSTDNPDACASTLTQTIVSQGLSNEARRTLRFDILAIQLGA